VAILAVFWGIAGCVLVLCVEHCMVAVGLGTLALMVAMVAAGGGHQQKVKVLTLP